MNESGGGREGKGGRVFQDDGCGERACPLKTLGQATVNRAALEGRGGLARRPQTTDARLRLPLNVSSILHGTLLFVVKLGARGSNKKIPLQPRNIEAKPSSFS